MMLQWFAVRSPRRDTHAHACDLGGQAHLEVAVDDAHVVEVLHRVQDLLDEFAGVLLRVEALLNDAVKQLPSGDPASGAPGSRLVTDCVLTQHGRPH